MNACTRRDELIAVVRAGQWPQGCAPELREHVAACARCAEEARILSAFATAHDSAMQLAPLQSPGLLWWKAQLRRRHDAMERLERPGLAIPTATIAASIVLLLAVLATAWKHVQWSQLAAQLAVRLSPTGWNPWMLASIAAILCGFAVAALVVGLGLSEERS